MNFLNHFRKLQSLEISSSDIHQRYTIEVKRKFEVKRKSVLDVKDLFDSPDEKRLILNHFSSSINKIYLFFMFVIHIFLEIGKYPCFCIYFIIAHRKKYGSRFQLRACLKRGGKNWTPISA